MKKALLWLSLFVCAAVGVALIGCGGDDAGGNKPEKPLAELEYELQDDGTYAVSVGNAGQSEVITVPSTYEGKAVTAVAENGFSAAEKLTAIELPSAVVKISAHAFDGCKNLKTLKIDGQSVPMFVFNKKYSAPIDGVDVGEYAFSDTAFMSVDIADSDKTTDDTLVNCTVKNRFEGATTVTVTSALNASAEKTVNTIAADEAQKSLDFGTYGLFKDIDVSVTTADGDITISGASGVGVTATKYNFAHLNASYPVLVFSLKLKEITNGGTIPTFVLLDRIKQYDWNALTYNMKPYPFVDRTAATTVSLFHQARSALKDYIGELYALNPDSHFTLYCVDNYGDLILETMIANGIPEDKWNAVMLSDGQGTSVVISRMYSIDNASVRYESMKDEWASLKETIAESGEFSTQAVSDAVMYNSGSPFEVLKNYAYVIAREQSNVEWWVNRLRAGENLKTVNDAVGGKEFVEELLTHVQQMYTNNLLSALDETAQAQFKTLYKFSENMFDAAKENNKEVVVILGTSWSGERGNLYEYIKLLVELYGTEKYEYYYKGHPGYPTSQYTERQEYFDELESEGYVIHELENAIAAEIILFYNPEVNMAGYSTSTFDSVTEATNDKALLLFGSKASFETTNYKEFFDVFASKLDVSSAGSQFNGIEFDENETYFLLEYNNTEKYPNQTANYAKHEIAIYSVSDKRIKYYKYDGAVYNEVGADGTPIE